MRKIEELKLRIRRQFEGSIPETPNCEKVGEWWEETREFWEKTWDELVLEYYERNAFCFAFLGADNFRYFFGAMMFKCISENQYQVASLDLLLVLWQDYRLGEEMKVDVTTDHMKSIRATLSSQDLDIIEEFFAIRKDSQVDDDMDLVSKFTSFMRLE